MVLSEIPGTEVSMSDVRIGETPGLVVHPGHLGSESELEYRVVVPLEGLLRSSFGQVPSTVYRTGFRNSSD